MCIPGPHVNFHLLSGAVHRFAYSGKILVGGFTTVSIHDILISGDFVSGWH